MPTGVDDEPTRRIVTDCGPPTDELKTGRVRAFWEKIKPATAQATRRAVEPILKVGAMGRDRAKAAGQLTARKVFGLQQSANLPQNLVEKSARSVLERPMNRASDVAWQGGYREVVQTQAPHMFVPKEIQNDFELG